jgi:uncharacterized protein YxeA
MKNSILTILAVILLSVGTGFVIGKQYTDGQYTGYVELHKTNSGTFVLSKDRIFTVSELVSNK